MSTKKTISLPDYVAAAAEQKSKTRFGGNFSNYLQWLICTDNPDEIKRMLAEMERRKPKRISDELSAEYTSRCPHCGKKIKVGDRICKSLFDDGHEQFVHKRCARE